MVPSQLTAVGFFQGWQYYTVLSDVFVERIGYRSGVADRIGVLPWSEEPAAFTAWGGIQADPGAKMIVPMVSCNKNLTCSTQVVQMSKIFQAPLSCLCSWCATARSPETCVALYWMWVLQVMLTSSPDSPPAEITSDFSRLACPVYHWCP